MDNLQPDFLYDHIQPVRAELMQALWRTLRNPVDNLAHVAFRVLGKFGGGNRKMLREPQTVSFGGFVLVFASFLKNALDFSDLSSDIYNMDLFVFFI